MMQLSNTLSVDYIDCLMFVLFAAVFLCIIYKMSKDGPKFVGIKFCQECNNMLYPKEDKENRRLMYACRNCEHKQVADNMCIYVNKIQHDVDEMTQIIGDVIADPTLPRTEDHPCKKCGHREAVFFQSQTRRAQVSFSLLLILFKCFKPLGMQPSHRVCKPAYLVPVPSQDKLGGLYQEEHLA